MSKLKAIIVDDERLARVNLKNLLKIHKEVDIIGEAESCNSAVEVINKLKPNLIFLDIQLSGETGFDVLEQINSNVKVIFVTAYDEYAIRAFEVNAVDYLLKPVNPKRLSKTIKRISEKAQTQNGSDKNYKYEDMFYTKLNNYNSKFIKISSITAITSEGNYTKVTVNDGKNYLILKTLKEWENSLPQNHFIRIHRTTIVNINQIIRIEKSAAGTRLVYLENIENPFEISRRYAVKINSLKL